MRISAWIAAAIVAASPAFGQDCGGWDAACAVAGGSYHIELPDGAPRGALVFLHGWGSRGAAVMGNRALVEPVLARGFVMVAPNGMPRGQGDGLGWSFHPDFPAARDEAAFFASVFADVERRTGLGRDAVLMGGFSAGGFMTSYLACAHPDAAAAYVPVSGGFWRPHPEACAGPVRLFHTHGWSDTVVPLEGRYLGGGDRAQGDIFHGMEIWRAANGCDAMQADRFDTAGRFWRRSWDRCIPGSALDFAVFSGGHSVPAGWAEMVLDWFEGLEPAPGSGG